MSRPARLRRQLAEVMLVGLLATWALGLGVATVQLARWQRSLVQVLVQMRADMLVQASAPGREALDPAWNRRQAATLLDAVEHLHDDQWWSVVMPCSWQVFDDMEERATDRVATAFSQGVVATMSRELEARGARLGGAPGPGAHASCEPHGAHARVAEGRADISLSIEQMPEYRAMLELVEETRGLDRAARALRELRLGGPQASMHLRELVAYTLGAQVSRTASRSLALFQAAPDPLDPWFDALAARLEWQARCAAIQGMSALQARLVEYNPVLAVESDLAQTLRPALFATAGDSSLPGTGPLRRAVQRIDHAQALLEGQQAAWMAPASPGFGKGHERLLGSMAEVPLLGPELAHALRAQADADHVRLLAQVRSQLGRPAAALAWEDEEGRFTVAPRTLAARHALAQLLKAPFMAAGTEAEAAGWDLAALEAQRQAFEQEVLPRLPARLQEAARDYVAARLSALSALPGQPGLPLSCLPEAMQDCPAQAAPGPRGSWDTEGAAGAPASSAD